MCFYPDRTIWCSLCSKYDQKAETDLKDLSVCMTKDKCTARKHGGIYSTNELLSGAQIKTEHGRIRWKDEDIEEAKVQTEPFGNPQIS